MVRLPLMLTLLALAPSPAVAAPSPYPTTPLDLGARVTAVGSGVYTFSPSGLGLFWVGSPGRVLTLAAQPDGTLAVGGSLVLPPDAVPLAVTSTPAGDLVLDGAHDRLLVYGRNAPAAPALRLPVGPGASALAVGDTVPVTVAVANSGSNDVSVFELKDGPSAGPEVRVSVGAAPDALAFAELTRDDAVDLAVSNAGSGTVSVLVRDGHGGFAPGPVVPVGGAPGAIAVTHVNRDPVLDLIVADASAPRLITVLGARSTPVAGADVRLPDPASRATALVLAHLNRDFNPDLAIADRGTGTVRVLYGTPRAGFGSAGVLASGVDPVGLFAGSLGGDPQGDLAVGDARTQTVRLLLTPGDRLVSPGVGAQHLDAGDGVVAWSRRRAEGDYRLELFDGASISELPVPGSARALVPHLGERASGRAVVTYLRCRRRACRPYLWDVASARERALAVPAPRGCRTDDVALWHERMAYVTSGCRSRGLWLRTPGRPPRRLAAHALIGALRGDRLAWLELHGGGNSWLERLLSGGGRARTLDGGSVDTGAESVPAFDGAFTYWTDGPRLASGPWLIRYKRGCRQAFPAPGLPPDEELSLVGDFAVLRGRVFYADETGVFELDAARLRWSGRC